MTIELVKKLENLIGEVEYKNFKGSDYQYSNLQNSSIQRRNKAQNFQSSTKKSSREVMCN